MLKNIAKAEAKEESKNIVETKEENRIKYLEIYNDEIINNNNIQDSIQLFYTPKMNEFNEQKNYNEVPKEYTKFMVQGKHKTDGDNM